jgi:hypothetical protein
MEFRIHLMGPAPDLDRVASQVGDADPSALVDVDPDGALRLSTMLGADELVAALSRADVWVRGADVERLPSTCCGGCGG